MATYRDPTAKQNDIVELPRIHRPKLVDWEVYVCPNCVYKYNELTGEPLAAVPPYTRVEKLYGNFHCPYCFTPIESFMPAHTIGWA